MQVNLKALMAVAVGALAGACSDDAGRDAETVADEPAVDTARDRVAPVTPPQDTSPTGMTAGEGADAAVAGTLITAAVAQLRPTEGQSVQGAVRFELASAGLESAEMDGTGIEITGTIEGLSPGQHGFHVHEFGDCSAPDGSSAGDHFNPEAQPHGGPDDAARHIGDLGNLDVGEEGQLRLDVRDDRIRLSGRHSIIGRGLVVHANADDLESQPSGAAGPRVACGVIGIAGADEHAPQPAGPATQPGEPPTPGRTDGS